MTIVFQELAGSPVERHGPEGLEATRRLLCRWEDRQAFIAALLGEGYALGVGYPGAPGVLAVEAQVEPFHGRPDDQGPFDDPAADLNAYSGQLAAVTVRYRTLDELPGPPVEIPAQPGTILSYRMEAAAERIVLAGQSLRWQHQPAMPVPPEAVPALRAPIVEHRLTWRRVTSPPWATIRGAVGCVNGGPFLGAAAETVLFDGASAAREFLVFAGQQPEYAWRIEYVFRERAIRDAAGATFGWNHAYRPLPFNAPGIDRLADAAGRGLYPTAHFGGLFFFG